MKILLTGAAGFIGMHVAKILLERGDEVVGLDNLTDYYDPRLKQARLEQLTPYENFRFVHCDISNRESVDSVFAETKPKRVINLAAQPGVRYSIDNPSIYLKTNILGFGNILEACRNHEINHLVYASSSSVYGLNANIPFSVSDHVDHPVSLYAASKKANELMAHSYSHLYGLPTTGLRYFTVYGPWGRPDMSPWIFTSAINEGRAIDVYNFGKMKRDFTYIDDIAVGTVSALDKIAAPSELFNPMNPAIGVSSAPYRIYNIGNNSPVELMDFIGIIEQKLEKKAIKNLLPIQSGDVISTYANIDSARSDLGYVPKTQLEDGLVKWVKWYKKYMLDNKK